MKVVFVTTSTEAARSMVRALVDERLIACGNILDRALSIYRWEGRVCEDEEAVVFMETEDARVDSLVARLRELHPYDCPKIVVLDPAFVTQDYASWVRHETGPQKNG